MAPVHVAAVDLGASSGRVMVGTLTRDDAGRTTIALTETRRFTNGPAPLPSRAGERLYWDVLHLWNEIREGLLAAVRQVGPLSAVGVDTWAVDYGLVNKAGLLTGHVASYRCQRTQGVPAEVFARIPAAELYRVNGLQVQDFNTVFQLLAASREGGLPDAKADGRRTRSSARSAVSAAGGKAGTRGKTGTSAGAGSEAGTGVGAGASTMLLLPDLIAFWLTGRQVAEVTNASTTGLLDARTRTWSAPLLARLREEFNLDLAGLLPATIEAGTVIGPIRPEVIDLAGPDGRPTPLVAVGSHDTASAVVAVPAQGQDFAYISCGTWSLVGLELTEPILTEASRKANFTNELGVDGTVRYLKNVMGLWVFNEAVRTWRRQGLELSYAEMDAAAAACEPLRTVVDVNDPVFFAPGDMAARIDDAARATGQPTPRSVGEYVRCIDDSLALAYRRAVRQASALADRSVPVVHVVGGGIRNRLLCQLAADAIGLPVLAGPAEGTALGNTVVAARGAGLLDGDLAALRQVVRASSEITTYTPNPATAPAWDAAERRLPG
ncbi:rhamnulokinase [Actinomyces oricola]